MKYNSTRGQDQQQTAGEAILQGIAKDGGLFVPQELPQLRADELERMCRADYRLRAEMVLGKFLTDYSADQLAACVCAAYGGERFEKDLPAPLAKVGEDVYVLELWHGPTCAFKDLALQLLPHLMATAAKQKDLQENMMILTATSGDTGKAALEGFADAPGVQILVFYPRDGVSEMQKLQMCTQSGSNVDVCAVEGNFDDAQNGVKAIFSNEPLLQKLKEEKIYFSSANSINWGRLVPQIVYYFSAYCDLIRDEEIAMGDLLNVVVPTGNFGNILAAYYAKQMGLPLGRLICASNRNNVLTEFMQSGVYDRNRPFTPSLSPSMDILISSNLERLLFELCGRDAAVVQNKMETLAATGRYQMTEEMIKRLHMDFSGGFCSDEGTRAAIRAVYEQYCYVLDPHTAVGWSVYEEYRKTTRDETKTLLVSTASPYKFADSVCEALGVPYEDAGLFAPTDALFAATECPIPEPLQALRTGTPRFFASCAQEKMAEYVAKSLGL